MICEIQLSHKKSARKQHQQFSAMGFRAGKMAVTGKSYFLGAGTGSALGWLVPKLNVSGTLLPAGDTLT